MKAALLDEGGHILALEGRDMPSIHPFDGASEVEMNATWALLAELTIHLAQMYPGLWKNLVGICITGQGDGCWPVSGQGKPVRNAMLWNDIRSRRVHLKQQEEIEKYCQNHSLTQLFPGAAPMLLLWMKEYEPQNYQRTRYVLHCKDWLNYRLTGEYLTDYSDASTALMNIHTCQYDTGLLDLLGIPEVAESFPEPRESGSWIGKVTQEAAKRTALPEGLPVILGGIDVSVVAAGAQVLHSGDALTILGTTLSNEIVLDERQVDSREIQGSTLRHVAPGRFLRLMATSSGSSSIDWARATLAPGISFDKIEVEIGKIQPGCEGVMYHPYLYGERAPFRNPKASGGFYGLSARHTPMHLLRAVYEGLVFSIMDCYGILPKVDRVTVTGGGANSNTLCQILADGLGVPVRRISNSELGIQGAFQILKKGLGNTAEPDEQSVSTFEEFIPDTANNALYRELFELFIRLRESLTDYWNNRESIFRNLDNR